MVSMVGHSCLTRIIYTQELRLNDAIEGVFYVNIIRPSLLSILLQNTFLLFGWIW